MQVNVFELGHTYLQLVQALNLRLPLVDPSHYISRFAALLEFGDETHAVAHDAVRLVQRFDRDWLTKGRRPAGICGAALLLAARMNHFRRSIEEIVQVVKIADTTLRKRLDEFKKTPSGSLTLADFRNVWLEEEMDPPAFTKAKEKAADDREEAKEGVGDGEDKKIGQGKSTNGKKKRKRGQGKQEQMQEETTEHNPLPGRLPIDLALLSESILEGAVDRPPLFLPDYDPNMNIDPVLLPQTQSSSRFPSPDVSALLYPPQTSAVDETASLFLTEEVSTFLQNPQGAMLSEALDEAELRRRALVDVVDELQGLDEEELDRFLLTDEEVRIKERVWVELNKDYLEAIAGM
jgi:transcription factor IIIB subunit 2